MPKLGMGPIRREQICRAAAQVIAEHGFAGTTMRMVAETAGVSTGMLNHYFANRMDMLEQTLVFVSERQQARELAAIEKVEPGEDRLRAWCRANLPSDRETEEVWRVWIAAYGASGQLEQLRRVMAHRNELAFKIVERALEGIVPPSRGEKLPYASQFDALMTGLVMQAIATEQDVTFDEIEDIVVATAIEHGRACEGQKAGIGRKSKSSALTGGNLPRPALRST